MTKSTCVPFSSCCTCFRIQANLSWYTLKKNKNGSIDIVLGLKPVSITVLVFQCVSRDLLRFLLGTTNLKNIPMPNRFFNYISTYVPSESVKFLFSILMRIWSSSLIEDCDKSSRKDIILLVRQIDSTDRSKIVRLNNRNSFGCVIKFTKCELTHALWFVM